MINRRITRVVLNTTEVTANYATPDAVQNAFALTTTDELFLGFHGKFASRYVQIHTANANASVMSVTYWDGSAWTAVDDLVDQTSVGGNAFAQSGFVSWQNKDNWVERSLTGVDSDVKLFWVKIQVSANLSAGAKVHAILNLFSDDVLLRSYFPEIVTDANYLPSGKTNFLQQHMAAKDLVVLRLKQRKLIDDESQVIDVNDVSTAAVYGCAKIILQPIATSDASKAMLDMAIENFDAEISKVTFAVDENMDGQVEDGEREQVTSFFIERR